MSLDTEQPTPVETPRRAVIIGGGPAGLMAAEVLSDVGLTVDLYDAMPSVGRKFLLAGKGGLNLSHAEAPAAFLQRYSTRQAVLQPMLDPFDANAVRAWCAGLGIATFVGSSGRIFPTTMKAAPLLRAWLHRLRSNGVRFHMRHVWRGFETAGTTIGLRFDHLGSVHTVQADVVIMALGGASWKRLGSDGAWVPLLSERGIQVAPLQPSNCGFEVSWSGYFQQKFAGQPLKSVALNWIDMNGTPRRRSGECMLTADGIEGGLVYAASAALREQLLRDGVATIWLDLLPDKSAERVLAEVAHPRAARSLSSHLQSRVGLHGVKAGLLRELLSKEVFNAPRDLALAVKSLPIVLTAMRPIDEAISSAGGVCFEALDAQLMARSHPGLFFAGEMLDWEAPTGGYLLTACFATARHAAHGALRWLAQPP